MSDIKQSVERKDLIRLIKERGAHEDPSASPFTKELKRLYVRWYDKFKRRTMANVQKPKYQWTRDLYEKFREIPVEDLVNDTYYLGLRDEIYPIHLDEIVETVRYWREGKITEIIDVSAIGVGKSFKAAIYAWILAFDTLINPDPAAMYGLAARSRLAMVILSRNAKLAREVTFAQILPFFDCPFFVDYFPPQVNLQLVEETRQYPTILRFPNRFAIFPGTGSFTSILGFNIIGALLDEFAWMEKVTKSSRSSLGYSSTDYDAALEAYNATDTRIFSRTYGGERRGLIVMTTSPRTKWDFAEKKFEEGTRNMELLRNGGSLNINGLVDNKGGDVKEIETRRIEANAQMPGKACVALKRKSMWRARPILWKGMINWSGKFLLFDTKTMQFKDKTVHEGLFNFESDIDDEGYLRVPIEVSQRFIENPYRALRDVAAQATAGIHRFFNDLSKVVTDDDQYNALEWAVSCFRVKADFKPETKDPGRRYGHVDLGLSGDRAGVSLCYCSGWKSSPDGKVQLPICKFDFIAELRPLQGDRDIQLDDVLQLYLEVRNRKFDIGMVTYDKFQSVHSIQKLWETYGIPSGQLSIDNTTSRIVIAGVDEDNEYGSVKHSIHRQPCAAWIAFRNALNDGRILLPTYEKEECSLLAQFEQEEYFPEAKGGLGVIDHPPGGKHDLLQSIVGSYWNMLNNEWWISTYIQYEEDNVSDADMLSKMFSQSVVSDEELTALGITAR